MTDVKDETTYLYWIHLQEHVDIFTEGYIGVTKRPKRRFYEHSLHPDSPILESAYKKYKDIVSTVLMIGPKDYCYEMEEKLRPTDHIGWNIAQGGKKPPVFYGDDNVSRRPEVRKLISERKSGENHQYFGKKTWMFGKKHREESNELNRQKQLGRKWFHDPVTGKTIQPPVGSEPPFGWLAGRRKREAT